MKKENVYIGFSINEGVLVAAIRKEKLSNIIEQFMVDYIIRNKAEINEKII